MKSLGRRGFAGKGSRFARMFQQAKMFQVALAFLFIACTVLMPPFVAAQTQGSGAIQGTVLDPAGNVIPNAAVTAVDPNTGHTVVQRTSSKGFYVLPSLPPATYNVTIQAAGFEPLVHENVTVSAFATVTLDANLHLGTANQTVTVTTRPSLLDTSNGTLEVAIPHETYNSLPVAMNDAPKTPLGFVSLSPGVTTGGNATFVLNGGAGAASAIYINGMPDASIAIGGGQQPITTDTPLESVENSQVLRSGIPAYYEGAGVINLVMKSGTNTFHGSLYENIRNTVFDAAGYFSPKTPVEHQNEFGGTIGGPIIKNRLFFFFNYDGFRWVAGPKPVFYSLPTEAERQGDFSALSVPIYDPATTVCVGSKCTATPFPGNKIPANRISSISRALEAELPTPINSSLQNNILSGFSPGDTQNMYVGKLDFTVTKTNNLSFLAQHGLQTDTGLPAVGGAQLPLPYSSGRYGTVGSDLYQVQDTQTFRENLVNVFGYQIDHLDLGQTNPTTAGDYAAKAGLKGIPGGQASENFPPVSFAGPNSPTSWALYNFSASTQLNTRLSTFQDSLQWIHGSQDVTVGGTLQYNEYDAAIPSQLTSFAFSNFETAGFTPTGAINPNQGNAYASFLLGDVNSASLNDTTVPVLYTQLKNYAFYVQDDWKVSQKLTLNLGYRYEIPYPVTERYNKVSFLNPTAANPAVDGYPGTLEFAGNGPDSCNCRTLVKTHYLTMSPRVGFAYAPKNSTVLSGSFSVMHFKAGAVGGDGYPGDLGYAASPSFTSPNNGITPAFNWNNGVPAYTHAPFIDPTLNTGYNTTTGPNGGVVPYTDPNHAGRSPYTEYWNFTLQQQLSPSTAISISYAGSATRLLTIGGGVGTFSNQLDPKYLVLGSLLQSAENPTTLAEARAIIPGIKLPYANFDGSIAQMLRPFPQYSGVSYNVATYGNGQYNSLQVLFQRSMSKGLFLHAAYTWQREIDNAGGEEARPGAQVAPRSAYNLQLNRSVNNAFPPQVLTIAANYMLPFGQGHALGGDNRVVNQLIGNWQLSLLANYNTAPFLGPFGTTCNLPDAGDCYADYNPSFSGPVRINGSYGSGQKTGIPKSAPLSYINANAFKTPAPFTYGTTPLYGAYGIHGVNGANEDLALDKVFPFWKGTSLKLRADAFNVFNRTILGGIVTNTASAAFGHVTTQANAPRVLQFEAYFNF